MVFLDVINMCTYYYGDQKSKDKGNISSFCKSIYLSMLHLFRKLFKVTLASKSNYSVS